MLRLFVSLISAFALTAQAEELDPQWLSFSHSGYASYTYISQPDFHESGGIVAVNGAVHYKNWSIKTQIANRDDPIRRLALEYHTTTPAGSFMVQVGRVPRLLTLYSDVFGNPSEWDMAVLPLAGYNRRMVHSLSFNVIDGIKAVKDFNVGNTALRVSGAYGYNVQEGCDWQLEAASISKCDKSWQLDPMGNNYNVSLEARINTNWTLITTFDRVIAKTKLNDPSNRRSAFLVNFLAQEVDYTYWRTGLRYNNKHGYVQYEHGENRTYFKQDLTRFGGPKGWELQASSADDYIVVGYYLNDSWTGYTGYSLGEKHGVDYNNEDTFVGVAYRHEGWTATLEHHRGHGGWVRHGSDNYSWEPVVASVTYSW